MQALWRVTKLGLKMALLLTLGTAVPACGGAEFVRKSTPPGQALIYVYRPSNMLGAFVNGAVTLTGPGGFQRSFPLRREDVDGVSRQFCDSHRGARLPRFWRSFGESHAVPSGGASASSDSLPSSWSSSHWARRRSPSVS